MYDTADTTPSPTTDTGLCPGKCNAPFRAAERRYHDTGIDHDLTPRDGQPVWCPPCTTAIRAAIADWPDLAARLVEEIESGVSARLGEYVSGSKNQPIHGHEAASFLLDEYAEWAVGWEATIRHELHLARRKHATGPQQAIGNATTFLLHHLHWHIAERADARHADNYPGYCAADVIEEFGTDTLRFHRRAQVLTSTQDVEPVRVAGVPCPVCDWKALEHEVEDSSTKHLRAQMYQYGDDGEVLVERGEPGSRPVKATRTVLTAAQGAATGYIRCRRCRPDFRMVADEYHQWTKLLAAGEKVRALATQDKLAEIFGGSVPTQYKALS